MGDAPDNGTARAGRKWVRGVSPEAPASDAARLVVGERMRRPGDLLVDAAADGGRTPEKAHQLRVATRRAQAALEAFAPLLEPRAAGKARRAMREIRRAAGPARVCDVHLELFGQRVQAAAASRCAAIGFVLGRVAAERDAAQARITKAAEKWPPRRIAKLRKRATTAGGDAAGDRTFAAFGENAVAASRARLLDASRANLRVYEHLHELRKAAKAMRYTLEIFRACMAPPEFNAVYERATEVQRRLGDLNDAHEMLERVRVIAEGGGAPKHVAPALAELHRQLERERDLARTRFLDWWAADRTGDASTASILEEKPPRMEAAS